jgi:hypothetical protein
MCSCECAEFTARLRMADASREHGRPIVFAFKWMDAGSLRRRVVEMRGV